MTTQAQDRGRGRGRGRDNKKAPRLKTRGQVWVIERRGGNDLPPDYQRAGLLTDWHIVGW